jgi:hypothetical protein
MTRCVFEKVAQNVAKSIFVKITTYISVTVEKSSPIIWATSVILTKTTQGEQSPIGENSPNLVTLAVGKMSAPIEFASNHTGSVDVLTNLFI